MNSTVRVIFKIILTLVSFLFFGGVLRGCMSAAQTGAGRGLGTLFVTIIFFGSLYGIWSYSSKKKSSEDDITLRKD